MMPIKKYFLSSLFLFFLTQSFSQDISNVNDNNFMTGNGKIFVVMAVVVVIVIGLFVYLINLDRKISKLEKNNKP
ncbi:MAG: CcmD family protein [Parafilimonas sp.]